MQGFIRGAALIYGLLAAALSLVAALLVGLFAAAAGQLPRLMSVTMAASLAALGIGLGLPLARAAWHSLQRRASPLLRLPSVWLLSLLFLALLGLGELALRSPAPALLLPPLHIAASLLPPLLVIAAMAPAMQRAGAGLTRRNLVTQLAYGALAATALAIALEGAMAVAAVGAAGAGVALLPGGEESLLRLAGELQSPALLAHPERVLGRLLSPALVLGLGLLVAAAIPLLEETIKSLGAVLNSQVLSRLSRVHYFAFGVMAGVGFSLAEALFYAAQQLPHAWTAGVAVRALTAVIHGAAAGLMALGWYEVLAGRPARFLLYAAGSVGLHGVWNALGGLSLLAQLSLLGRGPASTLAQGGSALVFIALAATWLASLAVLAYQTNRLSAELSRQRGVAPDGA